MSWGVRQRFEEALRQARHTFSHSSGRSCILHRMFSVAVGVGNPHKAGVLVDAFEKALRQCGHRGIGCTKRLKLF